MHSTVFYIARYFIVSRPSVCPSARLWRWCYKLWSCTTGWVTSKVKFYTNNSPRVFALWSGLQDQRSNPCGTSPNFRWNKGKAWKTGSFWQKTCNISETGKIGTGLLFITNRKWHTRCRLVPKSTTLDDVYGHFALCYTTRFFRNSPHKFRWKNDRPTVLPAS